MTILLPNKELQSIPNSSERWISLFDFNKSTLDLNSKLSFSNTLPSGTGTHESFRGRVFTASDVSTTTGEILPDLTDKLTAVMLCKPLSTTTTSNFLLAESSPSIGSYNWGLYEDAGGTLRAFVFTSSGISTNNVGYLWSSLRISTVLVMTYDGGTISLYVNGILISSVAQTGNIQRDASSHLSVQRWNGSGCNFILFGTGVTNRCVSPEEVRANFSNIGDAYKYMYPKPVPAFSTIPTHAPTNNTYTSIPAGYTERSDGSWSAFNHDVPLRPSVLPNNIFNESQQTSTFILDRENSLAKNVVNFLVCDPSRIPMVTDTNAVDTFNGYGVAAANKLSTPGGVFQYPNGGGYSSLSLRNNSIPTDNFGLFIFALFYKSGSASGQIVYASGSSSQKDGLVKLNSDSTITIEINADYTFTTDVIADGIHTIIVSNYRVVGQQNVWLDGVLLPGSSGTSVSQQGFNHSTVTIGVNRVGILAVGLAGVCLGKGADTFAPEFHRNPWQLFGSVKKVIPFPQPRHFIKTTKKSEYIVAAQPQDTFYNDLSKNATSVASGLSYWTVTGTSTGFGHNAEGRFFAGNSSDRYAYSSIVPMTLSYPIWIAAWFRDDGSGLSPSSAIFSLGANNAVGAAAFLAIAESSLGSAYYVSLKYRSEDGGPLVETALDIPLTNEKTYCAVAVITGPTDSNRYIYINGMKGTNTVLSGTTSGGDKAVVQSIDVIRRPGTTEVNHGNARVFGVAYGKFIDETTAREISQNPLLLWFRTHKHIPLVSKTIDDGIIVPPYLSNPSVSPILSTSGTPRLRIDY